MPVRIQSIASETIAEEIGIQPEDNLISINGHEIQDVLDYIFYQADEKLTVRIQRGGHTFTHFFEKETDEDIGLELYPLKARKCCCNCIFCFIDQIHPEARPSLKVKDDDFRLSFFHGNFITLSNLAEKDYKRIIKQHLSPLYISVHTTNDDLRQKIMRYKKEISIMEKLSLFAENDIMMHTQIVLVPGWNDEEELERTVLDLASLYPAVQSIGIVPLGLTKFREGLTPLKKVNRAHAKEVISQSKNWRKQFYDKYGSSIVSLADEFFLLAEHPIPDEEYYEGYPQIENGIGMVRDFLDRWDDYSGKLLLQYKNKKVLFVTGIAFYPVLKKLIDEQNSQHEDGWKVIAVENEFLGKDVTVAGLLAGQDVKRGIQNEVYDVLILPEEMFNVDGVTLDNFKIENIK
jgi:putative radical SAM enzyme (TIGR03279 family)